MHQFSLNKLQTGTKVQSLDVEKSADEKLTEVTSSVIMMSEEKEEVM